jgi:hypothetical protein
MAWEAFGFLDYSLVGGRGLRPDPWNAPIGEEDSIAHPLTSSSKKDTESVDFGAHRSTY